MKTFPICLAVVALFCVAAEAQNQAPPPVVCTATSVCENNQFAKHYEELGCKPSTTLLPDTCCPSSYDCNAFKKRLTNVCQYKGKNYNENAKIDVAVVGVRCILDCTCKKNGTGVAWSCTNEVCPVLASNCIPVYASTKQCCPTCKVSTEARAASVPPPPVGVGAKAPTNSSKPAAAPGKPAPAKTPAPVKPATPAAKPAGAPKPPAKAPAPAKKTKRAAAPAPKATAATAPNATAAVPFTCNINNVTFVEGENIPTDNCMNCLCLVGFNGSQDGSWCAKTSCGLELTSTSFMKQGCSPIYDPFVCCPIGWQCPTPTDVIVDVDLTKDANGQPLPRDYKLPAAAANTCTWGTKILGWFDFLDLPPIGPLKTMCSCYTPPSLTCGRMLLPPA